jgi:hypothetical protein
MRRTALAFVVCLAVCSLVASLAAADTIKDGTILYSAGHYLGGQPLKTGYDIFGYNYQAHMFNGSYANVYLGRDGFPPFEGDVDAYLAANPGAASKWYWYPDVTLQMKWNDQWMSNQDLYDNATFEPGPDGKLDRHPGYDSYIGSGAWETNHQSGFDTMLINGKEKQVHWSYFVKIVAVPSDATLAGGYWYDGDGIEMGSAIWGSFARIQMVYNDPVAAAHGKMYVSPAGPGFGQYGPE